MRLASSLPEVSCFCAPCLPRLALKQRTASSRLHRKCRTGSCPGNCQCPARTLHWPWGAGEDRTGRLLLPQRGLALCVEASASHGGRQRPGWGAGASPSLYFKPRFSLAHPSWRVGAAAQLLPSVPPPRGDCCRQEQRSPVLRRGNPSTFLPFHRDPGSQVHLLL